MKKMKIIAIKSGKGGCDKTTATINIAAADAELFDKKVLVIDTDGRGHTTSMFCNEEYKYQIGDLLLGRASINDAIHSTKWKNIDCICCGEEINNDLKELEKNIFMDPMHRLAKILDEISSLGVYDRCYIDCNQDPDLMAVNIMLITDLMLIPARSDDYSFEGITKMYEWMNQVMSSRLSPMEYKIMVTDKERNKESDDSVTKIKEFYGDHFCNTMIRHQAKPVQRSYKPNIKKPFVLEQKLAGVAEDYIELVKEIHDYD